VAGGLGRGVPYLYGVLLALTVAMIASRAVEDTARASDPPNVRTDRAVKMRLH